MATKKAKVMKTKFPKQLFVYEAKCDCKECPESFFMAEEVAINCQDGTIGVYEFVGTKTVRTETIVE